MIYLQRCAHVILLTVRGPCHLRRYQLNLEHAGIIRGLTVTHTDPEMSSRLPKPIRTSKNSRY